MKTPRLVALCNAFVFTALAHSAIPDASLLGDVGPDPAKQTLGDRRAIPAKSQAVPYVPPRNKAWLDVALFDKAGQSNQLIVRLNPASTALIAQLQRSNAGLKPASHSELEQTFIDTVDLSRDVELTALLGNATAARYLIGNERISDIARAAEKEDSPLERLHQFVVLRYATIADAQAAAKRLAATDLVAHVQNDWATQASAALPTDQLYQLPANASDYQWGMHAMNFGGAWSRTTGHAYVGIVDAAIWEVNGATLFGFDSIVNSDLKLNLRRQFASTNSALVPPTSGTTLATAAAHGSHVMGIVAGAASSSYQYANNSNNNSGVAGGCPNCSVLFAGATDYSKQPSSQRSELIYSVAARGSQVINQSANRFSAFGSLVPTCDSSEAWSVAVAYAISLDVLFVNSSGNDGVSNTAQEPASCPSVLAVGGVMNTVAGTHVYDSHASQWTFWSDYSVQGNFAASSSTQGAGGVFGVSAPAKNVLSAFNTSSTTYYPGAPFNCGSASGYDLSTLGDSFGTCTGTSMAAPHVSALAGILRSASPLKTQSDIQIIIRNSSSNAGSPNWYYGHGMPNAGAALESTVPSWNPQSRLTPLFSFYSAGRTDSFYTTAPQMGSAALTGSLQPVKADNPWWNPVNYVPVGTVVNSYPSMPGQGYGSGAAQAWIFTTPENPTNAYVPLVPLFRLSYACNHPQYSNASAQSACDANPAHTDTTYSTSTTGVEMFISWGYRLDGIEGYIYPQSQSQPAGTVRLMRKYNPSRDDHAIFPETELSNMTAQGYTLNSGSDWIGYVYPNSGSQPSIQ